MRTFWLGRRSARTRVLLVSPLPLFAATLARARLAAAMLGLLVGAALYAQPPHVKFPGLAVVAALRALARRRGRARRPRRRPSRGRDPPMARRHVRAARQAPPSRRPSAASSASASSPAPRTILRDVGGAARPGRLLAILGPSGSGKTSLLNVLARQVPFNPKMTLHGELVATSDDAGRNTAYRVAYVQQQDVFYSQLTVRETLQTAAELRARASPARPPSAPPPSTTPFAASDSRSARTRAWATRRRAASAAANAND